jgi:hypothetical protein
MKLTLEPMLGVATTLSTGATRRFGSTSSLVSCPQRVDAIPM